MSLKRLESNIMASFVVAKIKAFCYFSPLFICCSGWCFVVLFLDLAAFL